MDELRLILIIAGILVVALIYFFSRRPQRNGEPTAEEPRIEDTEWMEEIARQRRKLAESRTPTIEDEAMADVPVLDDVLVTPPTNRAATNQPSSSPEKETPTSAAAEDTPQVAVPEPSPPISESTEEKQPAIEEPDRPEEKPEPEKEKDSDTITEPKELIMALHITAPPERVFVGANLFSALEEVGLRFGEGGIFHYYQVQEEMEEGPVLFSVANILEPGTFEPDNPEEEFTTPGVVLFMRAPGAQPAREVIETMLLKSQQLAQLLGGEILDQHRKPLTEATIQSLLDQAIAFDRAIQHNTH